MRFRIFAAAAAAMTALGGAMAAPPPTMAALVHGSDATHAVFVQTNQLNGNAIQVYDRAANGALTAAGLYSTGFRGHPQDGGTIPNPFGPEGDLPLGGQDSLTLISADSLLLAVNAGSNTVSVFHVSGDQLSLLQVTPSGGDFPVSIAVNGDLVYVLNVGYAGSIAAFKVSTTGLRAVTNGVTSLNDGNTTSPPPYSLDPSDIAITPDGGHVLVAFPPFDSNNFPAQGWMDVFNLNSDGQTVGQPLVYNQGQAGPFGFLFTSTDPNNYLLTVVTIGSSGVETFQVGSDGTLTPKGGATDGQIAACWLREVNGYYFTSNTVSNNLSSFTIDNSTGQVTLAQADAADQANGGPIDETVSGDYLYVQLGDLGEVIGYKVATDGTLTQAALVTGLPVWDGTQGMEGIAAN